MTWFQRIGTASIRNIIAVLFTVGSLLYIYVLVFNPVPQMNKDLINVIGGSVLAGLNMVLSYYFGASKLDSKAKSDE